MTGWWERMGDCGDTEKPRPAGSVYEDRNLLAEAPGERWVQVAETSPLTGALRWRPGWERRAQG